MFKILAVALIVWFLVVYFFTGIMFIVQAVWVRKDRRNQRQGE